MPSMGRSSSTKKLETINLFKQKGRDISNFVIEEKLTCTKMNRNTKPSNKA
jgi:hypothetical protein